MKKNILVTGSHRSGSTWTGKIIAKASNVRYVHEPFNIGNVRKNSPFTFWFEHLNGASEAHQNKAKKYLNSFYKVVHFNHFNRLLQIRSLRKLYHFLKDLKARTTHRSVYKDPIAIMSAEWMYTNFNLDMVVLIRHPAAFVASLKVKNWQYDFNNYLNQSELMNTYLKEYKVQIKEYSENKKDIIDQGILLWNTIHDVIAYYQSTYGKEWYFVKHEDLSLQPTEEFEKMFSKINLEFTSEIKEYIDETTKGSERSKLVRNSKDNIKTWKNRLSEEEINRIKLGTENVWKKFYTEDDW